MDLDFIEEEVKAPETKARQKKKPTEGRPKPSMEDLSKMSVWKSNSHLENLELKTTDTSTKKSKTKAETPVSLPTNNQIVQFYQDKGWQVLNIFPKKGPNDIIARKDSSTQRFIKYHFVKFVNNEPFDASVFINNAKVNEAIPVYASIREDKKNKIFLRNAETNDQINI